MIKIIGCGNILRQDDGIGVYVIEELEKIHLSKNVELIDAGTRSFDMVSFLEGARKIIIVDGVKSQAKSVCHSCGSRNLKEMDSRFHGNDITSEYLRGQARPGTIYRVDIGEEEIDTDCLGHISTHELNWEDTLVIGRKIYGDAFPKKITFFGIEIENIETGLGLSTALKESLYNVVELIQKELAEEEFSNKM